ncbi:unnamed protein product [Cylicostephanus goldi]|uniref:Uncharacterized protein n=1 Tax=Cylicostephanus goldi TaxID=71465 RepID=A0A3P6RQC9_CYLGO|nr:unnamed protein product [Cylicostephanus goldi]
MSIQTSYSVVYGRTATYFSFDYTPNQIFQDTIPTNSSLYQQNNTEATTDLFLSSTQNFQESMIPSFSSLYQETNHTMNTTELFSSSTQETSIPTLSSLVQETNHTVPTSNIFSSLNTSANAEVFKGEKEVLLEATYSNTTKRRAKKDVSSIDALDITDNKFHSNPCLLQHRCLPAERCRDKASRVTYKAAEAAILEMDWERVVVDCSGLG